MDQPTKPNVGRIMMWVTVYHIVAVLIPLAIPVIEESFQNSVTVVVAGMLTILAVCAATTTRPYPLWAKVLAFPVAAGLAVYVLLPLIAILANKGDHVVFGDLPGRNVVNRTIVQLACSPFVVFSMRQSRLFQIPSSIS